MQDSTNDMNQTIETPMRLGHYLRLEREKRNINLKIMTQKTKISPTNLNFLEQDRYDLLPDKAYLAGFVKSYSKILNLDQGYCLKLLDQEFQKTLSVETELKNLKKLAPTERATPQSAKKDSPLLIKLVVGSFATLLVVVALVYFSNDYQSESDTTDTTETIEESPQAEPIIVHTEETASAQQAQAVTPEPTLTTEQIPPTPSTPTVSAPVERETSAPEENSEVQEEDKIQFRPITTSTFSYQALSNEDFERWYPQNRRAPLIEGQQVVHLNALDGDTWITYKADSEEIRRFILLQGRFITIRGNTIRMFLGNANALKIFHNNRLIDPESRTGVKSLVFPDSARNQFQLPLFVYPKDGIVLTSEEYLAKQLED